MIIQKKSTPSKKTHKITTNLNYFIYFHGQNKQYLLFSFIFSHVQIPFSHVFFPSIFFITHEMKEHKSHLIKPPLTNFFEHVVTPLDLI